MHALCHFLKSFYTQLKGPPDNIQAPFIILEWIICYCDAKNAPDEKPTTVTFVPKAFSYGRLI